MTDNVHRLFGVTADVTGLNPLQEYANAENDAAYQSWLRRRIAMLEDMQAERIRLTAQRKIEMDTILEQKQAEIDNLKASQTIGSVE